MTEGIKTNYNITVNDINARRFAAHYNFARPELDNVSLAMILGRSLSFSLSFAHRGVVPKVLIHADSINI